MFFSEPHNTKYCIPPYPAVQPFPFSFLARLARQSLYIAKYTIPTEKYIAIRPKKIYVCLRSADRP